MSALFDSLPRHLFRPLASPHAPLYVEVLLRLFAETQRHTLPLSRESALHLVESILRDQPLIPDLREADDEAESVFTLDYSPGTLPDDLPDDDPAIAPLNRTATTILRKLVQYGWLVEETQADYNRAYILRTYAFRLLTTLQELVQGQEIGLSYSVVAIRDALRNARIEGEADQRIPGAHRQLQALLNGLKELQHTIGVHVEQVVAQASARAVLEQFFSDYHGQIIAPAYHQLRTTDHISRYRLEALDDLAALQAGPILTTAAQQLVMKGEAATNEVAYNRLLTLCYDLRDGFDDIDTLLSRIDERHSQFVGAAVRAIESALSAYTTTSGQLALITTALLQTTDSDLPPETESLINLFSLELPDSQSLATPARAAVPFVPVEAPLPPLTAADFARAERETLAQLQRAFSRERIRRVAGELLQNQPQAHAASLPLQGPEEIPLLIYLRTYADGSLGYTLAAEGEWIERDGIAFRDFVIRRVEPAA